MRSSSGGVGWKTLMSPGGKTSRGAGLQAPPLILGPSGWESDGKLGHRLNISLRILCG